LKNFVTESYPELAMNPNSDSLNPLNQKPTLNVDNQLILNQLKLNQSQGHNKTIIEDPSTQKSFDPSKFSNPKPTH
jgi:hypothetical protein